MFAVFRALLLSAFCCLTALAAWGQTVYGVGAAGTTGTTYNRLFSVNATTGVATNLCALSFQSAAMAVSPRNGLVYYFEYNTAAPDLNTINPNGCVNGTAVATSLPTGIIRATFCPDGRLYASSSAATIYEINPATGATVRSFSVTGLPAQGSGDFTCTNNGSFYVLGTADNTNYRLYRANASIGSVANGGSLAFTNVGALSLTGTPNGLTEITGNPASCAASPNPCLIASTGTTNRIWGIDVTTGDADALASATGHVLTDLSRSYPLDLSVSKSATPTVVLQDQTVTYYVDITNNGPGVAEGFTVTDVLSPVIYESVAWTCAVTTAGTPTAVTSSCPASGTGSLNHTASLSLGGVIRYTIKANVTETFTGTLSNAAQATISVLLTDLVPANNTSSTASATVTPAALLSVIKSDNTTTVASGQTITYTITVVNDGPANAPGTRVRDVAGAGLNCTGVTFSSTPPGSVTVAGLSISALQSVGGVSLTPTFAADSTGTFTVTCGVTAPGS